MTFSQTWANAASLASSPPPIAAISAVMHVPIFAPSMTAIPASSPRTLEVRNPIAIPVIAVLDWIMAVMRAPAAMPTRICSFKDKRSLWTASTDVRGSDNASNPFIAVKTDAMPRRTIPALLQTTFLVKINIPPAIAIGIRIFPKSKVINSVLNVVPIFVPNIIPIDWGKVRILAEINPIAKTMTVELLWRTAVTNVPVAIPLNGVLVNFWSSRFSRFPEILNIPILIMVIPKMNSPMHKQNKTMYFTASTPFTSLWPVRGENDSFFLYGRRLGLLNRDYFKKDGH